MTDWQPIATAPKDGTFIVLWDGVFVPDVGKWFDHADGGWWVSHALVRQATHWLPLPPPPSAEVRVESSPAAQDEPIR